MKYKTLLDIYDSMLSVKGMNRQQAEPGYRPVLVSMTTNEQSRMGRLDVASPG